MNPFIFTGCTNYPRLSEKIQLYSSSTVHKKSFSIRFKNLRNYYLLHLFNCQYMRLERVSFGSETNYIERYSTSTW